MFYQILIVLFPLLVGSALTLLINYILQLTSVRADTKKFIRQNVEEVYTAINRIKKHFDDFGQAMSDVQSDAQADKTRIDITQHEEYQEIQPDLERVRALVNLYLPTLKSDFEQYSSSITSLRRFQFLYSTKILGKPITSKAGSGDRSSDYFSAKTKFTTSHEHLQSLLEELVK